VKTIDFTTTKKDYSKSRTGGGTGDGRYPGRETFLERGVSYGLWERRQKEGDAGSKNKHLVSRKELSRREEEALKSQRLREKGLLRKKTVVESESEKKK